MDENDPSYGYWMGLSGTYGDQYGDYPLYGAQGGESGDYYNPSNDPVVPFPVTGGNLETDYTVTDKGLIQDSAGNLGKFLGGQWVPYQGGDISSFLGKAGNGLDTLKKLYNTFKGIGGKAMDFAQTPQGIMSLLAALAAYKDRAKPSGGGTAMAYAGPKPVTRTVTQSATPGAPSPIVRYAAQGGLMQAYAQGGAVRPFTMQDGGFVMTKRAVDGAGGMQGMQQKLPEAVPIRGPGHGTSDSIPAVIQGPNGVTPAKVSNGEMYVPPGRDTRGLYALMRAMERKA